MTAVAQAPDAPRTAAHPFAIVAAQRTGSTLLVRSLDSSPLIHCAGEIFHDGANVYHPEWRLPRLFPGATALDRLLGGRIQRSHIRRHLTRYFATAGGGVGAVGFKVMTSQMRAHPQLSPVLGELGVTSIFLYRRDSFATALSYAKAKFTRVFHSDRAGEYSSIARISVPPGEFGALVERCLRAKHEVLTLQRERGGMLLAYEDMIRDWTGVIERIGALLDLPALRVDQALDKLGNSRERIIIENEDDLRRLFPVESTT